MSITNIVFKKLSVGGSKVVQLLNGRKKLISGSELKVRNYLQEILLSTSQEHERRIAALEARLKSLEDELENTNIEYFPVLLED